jgi:hypothetical protein
MNWLEEDVMSEMISGHPPALLTVKSRSLKAPRHTSPKLPELAMKTVTFGFTPLPKP